MRYSPQGKAITQFSIAINEKRGDKEDTEFLDFVCWEQLAERVAEYCRKGRKVGVQASYHVEKWSDNDGNKRTKVRFRARNVEFLDKPQQDQQTSAPQQRSAAPARPPEDDDDLGDLPF